MLFYLQLELRKDSNKAWGEAWTVKGGLRLGVRLKEDNKAGIAKYGTVHC